MSCSCNNDTSCGSCSDHSEERHDLNRINPHRHSTTRYMFQSEKNSSKYFMMSVISSSQFRRHKSASPSRRKSVPPPNQCACHHHHHHHHHEVEGQNTLHRHHQHHLHHMSATLRSKSTGQLLDDHHHNIRGSTRSRSRSKSKLGNEDLEETKACFVKVIFPYRLH